MIRKRITLAINAMALPPEVRRMLFASIREKLSEREAALLMGDIFAMRYKGLIETVLALALGLLAGKVLFG